MNTTQRIVKNFLSLAAAQIISQLLGFVAIVYLARILSAEGFGKLGFAAAILSYFSLLTGLGLNTFGTREVARNKEEIKKYVNNILTIRLIASIIAFALLGIFVYFIPKPLEIKRLILFLGFTLFTSAFLIEWLFQGLEKMELIAISRIIRQLAYVSLIFLIVKSPLELLKIPFIHIGAGILGIGFLFSVYGKYFSSIKLDFDFSLWKHILKHSLPMGFSAIMITIYYNFDHLMLGFMKDMEVVGWYSAAYKIILLVLALPGLVLSSFFPLLSRYYKEDKNRLEEIANRYVMIMLTLGIPIGFGGTMLAPQIVGLVYGQGFDKAVLPLQILMWNVVIVFINMTYGQPLYAWNKENKVVKIVTVGALTNLTLNLLLIPKLGLIGASLATVFAEIVVFFGVYPEFQTVVRINLLRYAARPFFASLLMLLSMLLMNFVYSGLFLLLVGAVLVYFTSLYFLTKFPGKKPLVLGPKIKSCAG